jgi:DNA (cytosine-5)-methyltransferase 1
MVEGKEPVTIRHFQQTFMDWLREAHGKSPTFQRWHKQHGRDDFRTAVTANVEFIWKEVIGVLGHRAAHSLQLFREIKHFTQYQPFASVLGDKRNPVQPPTVVTPYVFKCFGHCEFGGLLEPLQSADDSGGHSGNDPEFKAIEDVQQEEESAIQLVASDTRRARTTWSTKDHQLANRKQMIEHIKPGDTISTPPDGAGSGTKWKTEVAKGATEERRWFGLVQKVHVSEKKGTRTFDVTWLYRPVDTPCCKMLYPWSKELFLSDHCTCQGGRDARVDEDEVLAVHKVDWFGTPETTTAEFFVRQTYEVEHRRWVALEKQHMTCAHNKQEHLGYRSGDTVLATVSGNHDRAEAYEIVKVFRQGQNKFIRLRRLVRRSEFEIARPNELVYTDHMEVVKPYRILGKCIVRFFAPGEPVPCPYDRNGTANVFLITHKLENGVCLPLADRPQSMRQGFDPNQPVKKLRGLDLFCGSGNFGRGLEEGGVVDMCWTNDIWTEAVHTYMANGSAHTKPFLGSVDDLLRLAIEGNHGSGIPRRGDVDFISGGSPCQGFSLITSDRTQDRQKKNRSLVASFASFVEFYRPKYGILENVLNIVQTGQNRDEDAFSQLICAIVGMGYQTQLILGDAWTYGAPQSRSRAFLYFAAPGQRLPEPPRPSHSHFKGVNRRGLGKMTQGESFVKRSFNITPFKFVSAAEATADLPEIHDAKPDYCIGYPDHRPSIGVTTKSRHQYARIPIQPYGMNFVKTWNNGNGVMTPSERELFPPSGLRVSPISHGWGRVQPNGVFHTITTSVTPTDARTGRFLHWRENRPITILEARRAQGFLDHEVLTGSPVAQYELVGNSVARPMALALGLQFREAWLGSLYDDQHVPRHGRQTENSVVTGIDLYVKDEEELEIEWEDGGSASMEDTPDLRVGNATPATSVSESEAKVLASRKRSLSRSLAVDLHVSKARKVEVEHSVNEGGADAVILDKESPKRDGYAVLNPSNELVVPAS